jgi:hypothetical protein
MHKISKTVLKGHRNETLFLFLLNQRHIGLSLEIGTIFEFNFELMAIFNSRMQIFKSLYHLTSTPLHAINGARSHPI